MPMLAKHLWTAVNSPRGRFPEGRWARAAATYEALFYIWLLTQPLGPLTAIAVFMAAIHLVGVPLYFLGLLSRYARYGRHYGAFELAELLFLVFVAFFLVI